MATADIIVLILTVAVSISMVLTAAAPYILKVPPTDERSKLLASIVTAIIAIISLYIGSQFD